MFAFWNSWVDAGRLTMDAQYVIARRMMRLSLGGPGAAAETQRMVVEKFAALVLAQAAASAALATGASLAVAGARAAAPIRRSVRANRRRLSRSRG
jgi:hypothetical protein